MGPRHRDLEALIPDPELKANATRGNVILRIGYAMYRIIQPDAVGPTLVTIGATLMGVGAVQTAGIHQNVWADPWFDGGCVLVTPGALLAIIVVISWWRARRRPSSSPLGLDLAEENWRLFYNVVWVFGLAVSVTNFTSQPIILADYRLRGEPAQTERPPLAEEVRNAVENTREALIAEHVSGLFTGEITVLPGMSIIRWHIDTAYVPLPDGGRPHCTFVAKDTLDNTYELDIPARPPNTYRS